MWLTFGSFLDHNLGNDNRLITASLCWRLVCLLRRRYILHWLLKAMERIDYKLAVLVYKCLHRTTLPYLADEFYQLALADCETRQCPCSISSSSLIVQCTQLSTIGDRSILVAGARVCNGLWQEVTLVPSLPVFPNPWRLIFSGTISTDRFVLLKGPQSDTVTF